jgi:hypothetical protein
VCKSGQDGPNGPRPNITGFSSPGRTRFSKALQEVRASAFRTWHSSLVSLQVADWECLEKVKDVRAVNMVSGLKGTDK